MCASPDGWRIVTDDVELGKSVRTFVVAPVEYSVVPPLRQTIPVTPVFSRNVGTLGFCAPTTIATTGPASWSGTLWRQGADAASQNDWSAVATLDPAPGALGAFASPIEGPVLFWPAGQYILEARVTSTPADVWLGLTIQAGPG